MYFYVVLKKGKEFLAVLTNTNTQWELGHYYEQGYAFVMDVSAFNASSAIEIAKNNENSEIVKIQAELSYLRQEHKKLLNENSNLRFNNRFGHSSGLQNLNPLSILGFDEPQNQTELKKRHRELSQKFHPDKGGSKFLMQLINDAYEQLKSSAV